MRSCTQNGRVVLHCKLHFVCIKKMCHEVWWSWRPRNLPEQCKNACWNIHLLVGRWNPVTVRPVEIPPVLVHADRTYVGVSVRLHSVRCRCVYAWCIANPTCCIFVMGHAAALGWEEEQHKSLDDVVILDSVHLPNFLTNLVKFSVRLTEYLSASVV
jgi:hypothetical protein